MRHTLKWFIHLRAQDLSKISTLPVLLTVYDTPYLP